MTCSLDWKFVRGMDELLRTFVFSVKRVPSRGRINSVFRFVRPRVDLFVQSLLVLSEQLSEQAL